MDLPGSDSLQAWVSFIRWLFPSLKCFLGRQESILQVPLVHTRFRCLCMLLLNPVSCQTWTLKSKVRSKGCGNLLLLFSLKQHRKVLDICKAVNSWIYPLCNKLKSLRHRWAYINIKIGALICAVVVTVTTGAAAQNKGNLRAGTDGFPYSVWPDRARRVRSESPAGFPLKSICYLKGH